MTTTYTSKLVIAAHHHVAEAERGKIEISEPETHRVGIVMGEAYGRSPGDSPPFWAAELRVRRTGDLTRVAHGQELLCINRVRVLSVNLYPSDAAVLFF